MIPTNPKCDKCEKEVRKFKHLHKVNKSYLCNECYKLNRQKSREEMIKEEGIGEELKNLERKRRREYFEENKEKVREQNRNNYAKSKDYEVKRYNKNPVPIIKGSKIYNRLNKKPKSNAFISTQERQILFGMLIRKGLSYEEATEKIKDIVEKQKEIRDKLKLENKSDEEIKNKQKEMINELY